MVSVYTFHHPNVCIYVRNSFPQVAWGLSAVCGLGHLAHAMGSNAPAWLHSLHSTPLHAALSAIALIGERAQRASVQLSSLCSHASITSVEARKRASV